ncbi:MAG: polysaccharide biosynthesis protein [Prevotella sp.]
MLLLDKLANWYFNKNSLPYWGILLMDNTIVFLTYYIMFLLFNHGSEVHNLDWLTLSTLIYLVFFNVGFRIFHTYSGILRYSSFVDLQQVGFATALGTGLSFLTHTLLKGQFDMFTLINGPQMIASFGLATFVMWIMRMMVKTLYDMSFANNRAKRAYIFGVKNDGVAIAKHIRSEKPTRFRLKGFATIEPDMEGHILMGTKVHMLNNSIMDALRDDRIEVLIVSPSRLEMFRRNQKFQDELIKEGISIYITEKAKEMSNEEADNTSTQLKEISIEDLLPREEIEVDMDSVGSQLKGKCIMITGSAGSIGSEMVRQIAIYNPKELLLVDQAETPQHDISLMMKKDWPTISTHTVVASICEKDHMEALFKKFKPSYVFHAAAYKHVPMMEDNPSESVSNNIIGTRVIADLAVKYNAKKFVMISTDKAVNPTNVMGCSKRICEIYVQSLDKAIKEGKVKGHTQFVTTRFGNVLGSNGSVIPLFKEQIKNGGPITVTDPNIIRYFMLIPEACKLVLEAGTKGNGGEIFVFDMGEPVKISTLAERMIMLSGAKNIEIQYTGLRPGEKLYEEVLDDKETTKPSFHEKIRIATVRLYDYHEVCREIDDLYSISQLFDDMNTVAKMKAIVPEYKSNNSVYSKLDR